MFFFSPNNNANAQQPRILVELFTSQGCSSCPPADEYLFKLAQRPELVAIAYHVDYWDYIGWKDPFGKAEFTNRQRKYAQIWRSNQVYTPQLIINGKTHAVGSSAGDIDSQIQATKNSYRSSITSNLKWQANQLQIDINGPANNAQIIIVPFLASTKTKILRGENSGKYLNETRIADSIINLGAYNGQKQTVSTALPANANYAGVALILQNTQNFEIYHADDIVFK